MITHELIERIEGEAIIDFRTDKSGRVEDAAIRFVHFRGMETIMQGRSALDALVIAPRVCGICGHSHLIAAAQMLESLYRNSGVEITLSSKAQSIRRITRLSELLQNHLKWLYLIMLQESSKMVGRPLPLPLKALYAASQINRLAALFSGQWPHSSYALPGGVTCDPTQIEVMQGLKIVSETERFVETEVLGVSMEAFEAIRSGDALVSLEGDFGVLLRTLERLELLESGRSHGRFLVLGEHAGCESLSIDATGRHRADVRGVSEEVSQVLKGKTFAKNALYNGAFYETGPLARALVARRGMIEALHEQSGDGVLTRVTARVEEIVHLLREVRVLLESLDLSEPSFAPPPRIESLSGEGVGIVEAPRGTLIHRATLEKGVITSYDIITPTQWNLGNGTSAMPAIAQKAMIGAQNREHAAFIFRTFDVCSVCTTH